MKKRLFRYPMTLSIHEIPWSLGCCSNPNLRNSSEELKGCDCSWLPVVPGLCRTPHQLCTTHLLQAECINLALLGLFQSCVIILHRSFAFSGKRFVLHTMVKTQEMHFLTQHLRPEKPNWVMSVGSLHWISRRSALRATSGNIQPVSSPSVRVLCPPLHGPVAHLVHL